MLRLPAPWRSLRDEPRKKRRNRRSLSPIRQGFHTRHTLIPLPLSSQGFEAPPAVRMRHVRDARLRGTYLSTGERLFERDAARLSSSPLPGLGLSLWSLECEGRLEAYCVCAALLPAPVGCPWILASGRRHARMRAYVLCRRKSEEYRADVPNRLDKIKTGILRQFLPEGTRLHDDARREAWVTVSRSRIPSQKIYPKASASSEHPAFREALLGLGAEGALVESFCARMRSEPLESAARVARELRPDRRRERRLSPKTPPLLLRYDGELSRCDEDEEEEEEESEEGQGR